MLYDIYTAIKQQLTTGQSAAAVKGVEWYNVQYEGTIANTPRVFVDFPEKLNYDAISKQQRRTPLKVRLHVVSQAITGNDGAISDTIPQQHEEVANKVYADIEGFTPTDSNEKPLCSPLHLSAWQHFHKHKGWMVTFVEFDARKLLV